MVNMFLVLVEAGFAKSRVLPALRMLAWQTGSIRVLLEEWGVHVFPRSDVVNTFLALSWVPWLRMFSIRTPGWTSTTWSSQTWSVAMLETVHVAPWSLLYIIPAEGILSLSQTWMGTTRVPSCIVIPHPGPWKMVEEEGSLTCGVMLTGADQVFPPSELFTTASWATSIGSRPDLELKIE